TERRARGASPSGRSRRRPRRGFVRLKPQEICKEGTIVGSLRLSWLGNVPDLRRDCMSFRRAGTAGSIAGAGARAPRLLRRRRVRGRSLRAESSGQRIGGGGVDGSGPAHVAVGGTARGASALDPGDRAPARARFLLLRDAPAKAPMDLVVAAA